VGKRKRKRKRKRKVKKTGQAHKQFKDRKKTKENGIARKRKIKKRIQYVFFLV
jgi:hypothetical protein